MIIKIKVMVMIMDMSKTDWYNIKHRSSRRVWVIMSSATKKSHALSPTSNNSQKVNINGSGNCVMVLYRTKLPWLELRLSLSTLRL